MSGGGWPSAPNTGTTEDPGREEVPLGPGAQVLPAFPLGLWGWGAPRGVASIASETEARLSLLFLTAAPKAGRR